MRAVEWAEPLLPANELRYAMGLGTPPQLLELIARGMDMFDCVLPTRSVPTSFDHHPSRVLYPATNALRN
jgi:tRNA-guanine family transglycosylase